MDAHPVLQRIALHDAGALGSVTLWNYAPAILCRYCI